MVFAYIDPGMGSLAIQALIAGIVAIPFVFRNTLSRIIRQISRGGDDVGRTPRR